MNRELTLTWGEICALHEIAACEGAGEYLITDWRPDAPCLVVVCDPGAAHARAYTLDDEGRELDHPELAA